MARTAPGIHGALPGDAADANQGVSALSSFYFRVIWLVPVNLKDEGYPHGSARSCPLASPRAASRSWLAAHFLCAFANTCRGAAALLPARQQQRYVPRAPALRAGGNAQKWTPERKEGSCKREAVTEFAHELFLLAL